MLAPYTNIAAFMKEWRSRAPPTYRGFSNQSSAAITSKNQSSALLAINRNPQNVFSFSDSTDGSNDAAKIYGIVFGIFSSIVLIPLILGTCLLLCYRRKMRGVAEERARDIPVEQVERLDVSRDSSHASSPSSSSPNAPAQQPEHQVRRANSSSAIDGPTSTPSSPPRSSAVVENWVEGVILPREPGGILDERSSLTTMR